MSSMAERLRQIRREQRKGKLALFSSRATSRDWDQVGSLQYERHHRPILMNAQVAYLPFSPIVCLRTKSTKGADPLGKYEPYRDAEGYSKTFVPSL